MTLLITDTLANSVLNAFRLHIDGQGGDTILKIYGGTAPTSVASGITSATPTLAQFTLRNPCAPEPTARALVFTLPADVKGLAAGTATFFRVGKTSGTPFFQGAVTDGAGAGEMKVNKTAVVVDEVVSIVEIKISL